MTNDEAMKLARDVLNCSHNPTHPNFMSMGQLSDAALQLAKFIFSGDYKRDETRHE